MEVTREADRWLIEPLLRGINGQTCKDNHQSTPESAINAKGLHQEFITFLYPVHGLLPSRG